MKYGWIGLMLTALAGFTSCRPQLRHAEVRMAVDSLNRLAYEWRYVDMCQSEAWAVAALKQSEAYDEGRAEALNNQAFIAFMRMDFDRAEEGFQRALGASENEIERLVAEVGLMKVYQRTSMNKEFYFHRNSALVRMKRIDEDYELIEQQKRLLYRYNYARSEFFIVSSIYYFYLQQDAEACRMIDEVDEEWVRGDVSQRLFFDYMLGSGGLYRAPSRTKVVLGEFELLMDCYLKSQSGRHIYFEANALQALAELLHVKANRQLIRQARPKLYQVLSMDQVPSDSLPLELARKSLSLFSEYGDWYQISGAYRTISTCYIGEGKPDLALHYLAKALDYVNLHHHKYYKQKGDTTRLDTYVAGETACTELEWVNQPQVRTVPEWVARLREQLSLTYAALGRKAESDYNRNCYLDILDYTRQDKELESRYEALEAETTQLNILMGMVMVCMLLTLVVFVVFNRFSKKRDAMYLMHLKRILVLCRKITQSILAEVAGIEEVMAHIEQLIGEDLNVTMGIVEVKIGLGEMEHTTVQEQATQVYTYAWGSGSDGMSRGWIVFKADRTLSKEHRTLLQLLLPYVDWTISNGTNLMLLDDERRKLEKEQYVHEIHLKEYKRNNVVRRACLAIVTGMVPYIDRVVNEVDKLQRKGNGYDAAVRRNKLTYIEELIVQINEYNEILALWIKMRQGQLSLNIENFGLKDLFESIQKSKHAFDLKGQTLKIVKTDAWVKADKALTLFMMNTLLDNARKYTPKGGHVQLEADSCEDYVEISITDNGAGLSREEVERILGEKVYDSSLIGADNEAVKLHKGSGFGLINCKGIIEKYKKTNPLFRVCTFDIESEPQRGSRFFFRLPKGVNRLMMALVLLTASATMTGCMHPNGTENPKAETVTATDELCTTGTHYDSLLSIANYFSNEVYYANVNADYQLSLALADSVVHYVNEHYRRYTGRYTGLLNLYNAQGMVETQWFAEGFDTDYYILLDVRNEAAVACLAIKDFERYDYNNRAYTALYKQISEDNSLEQYCLRMEQSANNKIVGIVILILLFVVFILGYYFMIFRRRIGNKYSIEQVFAVNDVLLPSMMQKEGKDVVHNMVEKVFPEINELVPIDNLMLSVYDEEQQALVHERYAEDVDNELLMRVQYVYQQEQEERSWRGGWCFFPMWIESGEGRLCLGVLSIHAVQAQIKEEQLLLVEFLANYMAITVYSAIVKVKRKCHDIELVQDESRRTLYEENKVHVQNMVLDNCLSIIKHETIYYPNKIRQLLGQMSVANADEATLLNDVAELVSYYKYIFTLLSACASRQLEEITFRRHPISTRALEQHAVTHFGKAFRKQRQTVQLHTQVDELRLAGDKVLLKFMIERLIDEAARWEVEGTMMLKVYADGDFARFELTDTRRNYTKEELDGLFYPDRKKMEVKDSKGNLTGVEYLIAKQVIREHDEYGGRRGCRINAIPAEEGNGFTVWFTIPRIR